MDSGANWDGAENTFWKDAFDTGMVLALRCRHLRKTNAAVKRAMTTSGAEKAMEAHLAPSADGPVDGDWPTTRLVLAVGATWPGESGGECGIGDAEDEGEFDCDEGMGKRYGRGGGSIIGAVTGNGKRE